MATMEEILAETTAIMKQKRASYKSALAGQDPDSMPGSEKDKPIPEGAENADPEVSDTSMGPASSRSNEGAGDDSPLTRGHALEDEEPAENPVKKPLITADADAKQADAHCAKLANDLISNIHDWQARKAASAKGGTKTAAKAGTAKTTVARTKAAPAEKTATGFNMELTEDVLSKMAAIALSYDEGVTFMEGMLQKYAGQQYARQAMDFLAEQDEEIEKEAAAAQGYQDGLRALQKQAFDAGRASVAGSRNAPQRQGYSESDSWAKVGQEIAEDSIADLVADMPEGAGDLGGMPPEAAALGDEALGEMAAFPGVEDDLGVEDDFSIEELAEALEMLIEQGEIDENTAQMLLEQALESQGGDALGGEGMGEEDFSVEDLASVLELLVSQGEIDEAEAQQVLEYVLTAEDGGEGVPAEGAPLPAEEESLPPAEDPQTPEGDEEVVT